MERILENIEQYKSALSKTEENRAYWANVSKALIFDVLTKVQSAADLDWQVKKAETVKNLEAVSISFNKRPSGIVEVTPTAEKDTLKHGGALIFTQSYNGQVFIIHTYPYVEHWVGQTENKLIDKVDPVQIDEDYILRHVAQFLQEMSQWENSAARAHIGFAHT